MLVGIEHTAQPGVLARREQLKAGAGDTPNPIERIAGLAAPGQGLLLDALADQVQLLAPARATTWKGSITVTASGTTAVAAVL